MWHPVAKLTTMDDDSYKLNYTNGAKHPRFVAFPRMTDLDKEYKSNTLFPFFKNRIMPERRPEYSSMLEWTGLENEDFDPLSLLAISGGARKTDNFRIISIPENQNGTYEFKFFVSGVRYLDLIEKSVIENLLPGQGLGYAHDDENKNDGDAIILLNKKNSIKIGYYPRYLNKDFRKLENLNLFTSKISIFVVKVNIAAPEQYRLLCKMTTSWPDGFEPFRSLEYFDYSN